MTKAKLFMTGRSQAVRLPKEFRFEGNEVSIRRVGRGVLLEPVAFDGDSWLARLQASRGDPILPDGRQQPPAQKRDFGFE